MSERPPSIAAVNVSAEVLAERQRQIDIEGCTPQRDDHYTDGELAYAGAAYAFYAANEANNTASQLGPGMPIWWPWLEKWWKPTNARRNLVKAGALILAEIERIDRAAQKPKEPA